MFATDRCARYRCEMLRRGIDSISTSRRMSATCPSCIRAMADRNARGSCSPRSVGRVYTPCHWTSCARFRPLPHRNRGWVVRTTKEDSLPRGGVSRAEARLATRRSAYRVGWAEKPSVPRDRRALASRKRWACPHLGTAIEPEDKTLLVSDAVAAFAPSARHLPTWNGKRYSALRLARAIPFRLLRIFLNPNPCPSPDAGAALLTLRRKLFSSAATSARWRGEQA